MSQTSNSYDIIIVGGGMVGLTVALALAKQTSLSIAVLEMTPASDDWSSHHYHHRVSAIALSSVRIFNSLHVWQSIKEKRVSPFTSIHVWEEEGEGKISFDGKAIDEPVLGFIIENAAIQSALLEKIKEYPQIHYIAPVKLQTLQYQKESVELITDAGDSYQSTLMIAADGANSWVRDQAGIQVHRLPYDQKAIVATVKTSLPHHKIARQVFLKTGPLAFLPLLDAHMSSIVWSLPNEQADNMLLLSDDEFNIQLSAAFSHMLGEVLTIEKKYAFSLQKQQASSYIAPRIMLAGDAAHIVHPLAGQGVNMGLLDAGCLAEVIVEAVQKQRDYAHQAVLRRYERWRKADNAAMLTGIDQIKNLFASDKKTIQVLRSCGLSMTDGLPWVKNMFVRHAVGDRGDLPKMARRVV